MWHLAAIYAIKPGEIEVFLQFTSRRRRRWVAACRDLSNSGLAFEAGFLLF